MTKSNISSNRQANTHTATYLFSYRHARLCRYFIQSYRHAVLHENTPCRSQSHRLHQTNPNSNH